MKFTFNQTEIKDIAEFAQKYPHSFTVEVTAESNSGIGHLVFVTVETELDGDWVRITKTITDEKSW
jgi:hypothetical protein